MNRHIRTLGFAAFALLASTSLASASDGDYRQVWRDTEGAVVHNTWGNCVRSMWITDKDVCEPLKAATARTIIAQEDRTVYFGFNKSNLNDEEKQKLDSLSNTLMSADDVRGAEIVGYADRIGTVSYNEKLSEKRAETVRDYLTHRGFIKPSHTKTHWVGKSKPEANCPADLPHERLIECLQPDRKVTVEIEYETTTQEEQPTE